MILILQHWPEGKPGRVGSMLRDHGFKLDIRTPHVTPGAVPGDIDEVEGLVILGGPQNVTDIEMYPWMQQEAALIRAMHAASRPVVGICLGAQLIAHALGGAVAPREKPALGFHPLGLNAAGQTEPLLAGISWTAPQFFSCGQEITKLPAGATLLAGTKTIPVQAYKAGMRTFGFVFHFECDRPMLDDLARADAATLSAAGTTTADILGSIEPNYDGYTRSSERLTKNLVMLVFPHSHTARP